MSEELFVAGGFIALFVLLWIAVLIDLAEEKDRRSE